jgi:alpha-ribazole phosphatase
LTDYALVRHPPVAGGAGRCYGRLDLPLADPDQDIAALIAELADMKGAMIHTSPLSRCRLVADALAADWSIAALPDDRLLEMNFGAWEGMTWDDVPRDALDAWAADLPGFAPPGGETGRDLIARVSDFWAGIVATGGAHVIITHGGPLRVLLSLTQGEAVDLSRPAPAMGQVISGSGIGTPPALA